MKQVIKYGRQAREALLKGANDLADAVVTTLGPSGHSVILSVDDKPVATKDGVTVAKAITLEDPLENVGAQMLKQASIKTAEEAGDGTTTATLLARSMFREGHSLSATANTVEVRKGMEDAVALASKYIKDNFSRDVTSEEQIKHVATVSANGDESIGTLISKAISSVGQSGAVTIEDSKTGESYLDIVEGIQFDRGYKSPYFVTDEGTMSTVLEHAVILLADKRLSSIKELLPCLQAVAGSDNSLLIIAEDIDAEVLSTLILNKVRGGLKVCAVKAPDFGDRRKDALQDIATLTGGVVVSPDKGMKLEQFDPEWLGSADKVTVTRDKTTIIGAKGSQENIDKRIEDIQKLIENAKSVYDKEQLQLRLARFAGGVAIIYVGGHTEAELRERKDRVDDSLHAAKAAVEEGICPGGGLTLLLAGRYLHADLSQDPSAGRTDYARGFEIVANACEEPFCQILENKGVAPEIVWHSKMDVRVLEDDWEKNTAIIDPTKVVRLALKNAASVAGTMLTSKAVVVNVPEESDKAVRPEMY